jgi:hypothetical protein
LGFWLIAIGTLLQEHGIATQIRIQSISIIIIIGTLLMVEGQVQGNGSRLGHGLQFGIGCYRNSAAFHFGKRYNSNGNRKGPS